MDMNKLTLKSQEALSKAQASALEYGHQQMDGEHLLLALTRQEEGLFPKILEKMGIQSNQVADRLEHELARLPRVSGSSDTSGDKIYVTQRLNSLLIDSEKEAKKLKDEYVSVEHLLLAFLAEGNKTQAGKILEEFQVTKDAF